MQVSSDGYFTNISFNTGTRKYLSKHFLDNKKFLYARYNSETWTYNYVLPNFLKKGMVYHKVVAKSDFYSEKQSELLKFLNLCQTEKGLAIKGVPNKYHNECGLKNDRIYIRKLPENNDVINGKMINKFTFESYKGYNDGFGGTYDHYTPDVDVNVLNETRVCRAIFDGARVLVNGISVGAENLHIASIGPSEGWLIVDGSNSFYMANNLSDLRDIIDNITRIAPLIIEPHIYISSVGVPAPTLPSPNALVQVPLIVANLKTLSARLK